MNKTNKISAIFIATTTITISLFVISAVVKAQTPFPLTSDTSAPNTYTFPTQNTSPTIPTQTSGSNVNNVTGVSSPYTGSSNTSASQSSPSNNYTLLEPLPCIPGGKIQCSGNDLKKEVDLNTYMSYIFNLLIGLGAVAAVFMIVWGGFEYMGSTSFMTKTDGLKRVTDALLGLILILCTYILLRTINPRLVYVPDTLVDPLQTAVVTQQPTVSAPPTTGSNTNSVPNISFPNTTTK